MEFSYSYASESRISGGASATEMRFSPDTLRPPTFFQGELRQSIPFREAISALNAVVVSDLRFQPKDKTAYKAWAARQEELDWVEVARQRAEVASQIEQVRTELESYRARRQQRLNPFYERRGRYFKWLYEANRDFWFVLDPVITVHPDEIFFECFSQDESSYGRLGVNYEVFQNVGEFACGTTNVDYSADLYNEFQKIRSYKTTRLEVDPSGFEVQTAGDEAHKEVKIDLPDSWVRGFLQVSSAMTLPSIHFDLHPLDLHNICFILRRNKELKGPRSLRFDLAPGEPVKISFDPWNYQLVCPRSIYQGNTPIQTRVWGRRRIHILERLIPVARKFTMHLLGKGMPYFFVADLGDMNFTLGLSGWTANDWSTAGNFDLLAPRQQVDALTRDRVFEALSRRFLATPDQLADELNLERGAVLGALAIYTQAGRAMWDLQQNVYRLRELSREPLPVDQLRFANDREEKARRFVDAGAVRIQKRQQDPEGGITLSGTVQDGQKKHAVTLRLDADERLVSAECTSNWHQQNRLRLGPSEYILALRMQYSVEQTGVYLMN